MSSPDDDQLLTIVNFRQLFATALSIQSALLLASMPKEAQEDIARFTAYIGSCRPNQFFEPKSLGNLSRTVFENGAVRDFVLDLDARFFLSLNEDGGLTQTTQLARLLGNTCFTNSTPDRGQKAQSVVPTSVLGAYTRANHADAYTQNVLALQTDRWLMTLLLMSLEVSQQVAEKQMKEIVSQQAGRK